MGTAALALAFLLILAGGARAAQTVVTIGFDDGLASQYQHRALLDEHGFKATYFINSNKVGTAGAVTWAQLQQVAGEGNEVGGHTLDHVNLTTVSATEAQRQVCDDRLALVGHGFDPKNFAYPNGAWNASIKTIVSGCGYLTGRTTGGTDYGDPCCVFAETIPPKTALTLRAIQPTYTTDLAVWQDIVNQARLFGGGWVNLVVHGICNDPCTGHGTYDTPVSRFDAFLDWMAAQPDVSVRTTAQVMAIPGDTGPPAVSVSAPAEGASVTGTVTLTADASDDKGVDRVEFLVDGALVGTDTTAPYSADWASGTAAGNSAAITARATDKAGNVTISAVRTVTVVHPDAVAPTVALTAPADGATVENTVMLSADASDDVGVDHVDFLVGGSVVGSDTTAPYSFDWDSSSAGASATITARAYDAAGNGTTSAARTVTVLHAAPTVVTLGFDDGLASQYAHAGLLDARGIDATYFINSGAIGSGDAMTWAQLGELAAAGHEIGGHTLTHARLTTVSAAEQQHQVCDDRQALIQHGFDVRNFAYPFGAWDANVKTVVAGCGYSTARTTGGTDWPGGPVFAETVPPKNALTLRAIQPRYDTDLATWQDIVDKARYHGGGWVNIVVHGICEDPCTGHGDYDTPVSRFQAFLDWAQSRPGLTFKSTRQALNQAADTSAPIAALTAPADGANVAGTVALTADASDDVGVTKVEFLVDGNVVGSDATAPYSFDWDSSSAGSSATLAARAVDPSGNATTSAARTVNVSHPDLTGPTVTLTAPANGATVENTVTLSADASDTSGIDRVDFLVGGTVVGTDSSAPYSVDWDSSSAGASATIAARAYDTHANATTSAAATVTVKHAAPTVVVLGFDDGLSSQYAHRGILDAHGVKATYFVNSNKVGTAAHATWAELAELAAAGHEIGGHTLDHARLTSVTAAEQQRQVCDDRLALITHGFDVRNFAYPFGAWNASIKTVVAGCGYLTARTTGGLDVPPDCCDFAETVPPLNAMTIRAYEPRITSPLSEYQELIDRARYGGGGVIDLVLHDVCDGACTGFDEYSIKADTLDALLTWIGQQPGLTVKTTKDAFNQTGAAPPPPADTVAPTTALTAPANGATVTGTTTIAATASDNVAVTKVEFLVNGNVVGQDTTAPYSFDWNSAGAPASSTLAARASDAAGNKTTSATRTVTVVQPDSTAPTVSLTAPSNGATVSGSTTISASASDNVGVTKVEFLVDGAVVGTDTSSPYSVSWNSSNAAATATITAKAYDAAGNTKLSSARTVNVSDVLNPTATLTAPTAGSTVTGTVALTGTASDNRAVTRVDFLVGGSVVGQDTTAPYSFNWDSSSAGNSASITMRARDAAGNTFTTAATVVTVFHPDTTAPTVSLTAPGSLSTVSGNVTISASASDNVGVTLVEFLVNGTVIGSDATSPYAFVWNSAATAGSTATLTARAHDAAGNTKLSSSRTVFIRH
ncbi:MAG: Ig-like domain-containing protein [Conexibacter sp.]